MRQGCAPGDWRVVPLAEGIVEILRAPDGGGVHLGSPAILALPSGKLLVTCDQSGQGVRDLPGKKGKIEHSGHWVQGRVAVSRDKGQTWESRETYPFWQAMPFRDGAIVYLLGNCGQAVISRSPDGGETWGAVEDLTPANDPCWFVNAPANVAVQGDTLATVMMRVADPACKGELSSVLAPVFMTARQGSNLANRKSWVCSGTTPPFRKLLPGESLNHFGVPFFSVPRPDRGVDLGHGRWANRIGWRDAFLVRIADPDHMWHDASGQTLHLLSRADSHRGNLAVLARVRLGATGEAALEWQTTPAGTAWVFLPVPGGNMGFDLLYDETSRRYWLMSNHVADTMTSPDRLPRTRIGLPCEERSRLQLSFSRNLVDWSFAGLVTAAAEGQAVQHPRMAVHGADLHFVCCTGEPHRRLGHGGTAVSYGVVKGFRELAY